MVPHSSHYNVLVPVLLWWMQFLPSFELDFNTNAMLNSILRESLQSEDIYFLFIVYFGKKCDVDDGFISEN